MSKEIYAVPVYRYKNNELCSAFEEAKENEDFVKLAGFNAMEKRLKRQLKELSLREIGGKNGKSIDCSTLGDEPIIVADNEADRQALYECFYKQEPIEPNNKKCNLTFCRYNADSKCTNDEKRKECIEVSEKVLCIK